MSENTEQEPIRVNDKRRFTSEGEPIETSEDKAEAEQETPPSEAPPMVEDPGAEPPFPPPPAKFELLVMSLAMQAQMELGSEAAPDGRTPNIDIARHTIDLLAILQEKTKGNLTFEEQRQLDNAVTELRYRFVQRVGEINQAAKS